MIGRRWCVIGRPSSRHRDSAGARAVRPNFGLSSARPGGSADVYMSEKVHEKEKKVMEHTLLAVRSCPSLVRRSATCASRAVNF